MAMIRRVLARPAKHGSVSTAGVPTPSHHKKPAAQQGDEPSLQAQAPSQAGGAAGAAPAAANQEGQQGPQGQQALAPEQAPVTPQLQQQQQAAQPAAPAAPAGGLDQPLLQLLRQQGVPLEEQEVRLLPAGLLLAGSGHSRAAAQLLRSY